MQISRIKRFRLSSLPASGRHFLVCLSAWCPWKGFEDKGEGAHPCSCPRGTIVVLVTSSFCLSWIKELARKETRLVFSPQQAPDFALQMVTQALYWHKEKSDQLLEEISSLLPKAPADVALCVCALSHNCNGKRKSSSSRGREQNKRKLLWELWLFKCFLKTPFSGYEPGYRCFILLTDRSSLFPAGGLFVTVALRGKASGQNILENCTEMEKQNCYLFRCRLSWVLGVIAACVCNSSQDCFRYIWVMSRQTQSCSCVTHDAAVLHSYWPVSALLGSHV